MKWNLCHSGDVISYKSAGMEREVLVTNVDVVEEGWCCLWGLRSG